ncbi:DUF257 family protein [Thermococcus sp. 21S9]|uniref:DUF257 family protein n=1 Tax=Thermococcus sp. 21S9 TaxID=1638223 RepID=UPI0014394F50|nr:DUF257 family protein [Thermococcus sp. 21S9]
MTNNELDEILSLLKPGETVLIEYTQDSPYELLLWLLVRWALDRGRAVLVDDVLDTFPEVLARLDVLGFDLSGFEDIPVVKIGGSRSAGRVIGTIDVDRHSIDFRYYERIYSKVSNDLMLNPVLGFHKLFLVLTDKELLRLIRNVAGFVGKKDRIALYLVNSDVMASKSGGFGALFREIATTVLALYPTERGYVLGVVKTSRRELLGKEVVIL